METTGPFHWEMHLLAQEFNECEGRQITDNDNYLADQETLREYNSSFKQLEDRKHAHMTILKEEQELEIDRINKKYSQKLQELENEYINKRDALENELYRKSGKSYKKLQKLHTENLSHSQEFEGKAKDIFWRMASSLKEKSSICGSNIVRETPSTTAIAAAAAETPPVSPASGSTEPVSQAWGAVQNQYLKASPGEFQPLLDYNPSLEVRDTPPSATGLSQFTFSAPASPTAHLAYRPSPEIYSTKRQKTNDLPNTSARGVWTCSKTDAINAQRYLGIHVPIQPSSMATEEETFDSHANKSWFSPMKTSGQDLSSRMPASEKYPNVNHKMDTSTALASESSNKCSSTSSDNPGPITEQSSGQYNGFDEIPDVPYPCIKSASIERKVAINSGSSAKNSRRDLSKTQVTAQDHNVDSRTRNASTPIAKAQHHSSNSKGEALSKHDSMSAILPSKQVGPVHSQISLGDEIVSNNYMSFSSQRYASLQTARPFKGTPGQFLLEDGPTDDVFKMEEGSSFNVETVTPSKRKASDISMGGTSESILILKTEAPAGNRQEHRESFEVPEQNGRSTNHSRQSNAEPAERVIDNYPSINSEPSRQLATPSISRNSELARRVSRTPKPTSVAPARPVVSGRRLSIAEVRLSANCFSIEFMSYDPGSPSKCYPVTWSGKSGSPSYRLQVMKNKKNFLHPFDGTENKASQYPKLVIDDSWVLGGFFHIERENHRVEIYRPRSKKEYNEEEEQGFSPAKIESARMRIKFISEIELNRFLGWYRAMHPDAEIRPNTLLGSFRRFFRDGSDSDRTLRGEIENRARRIAPLAPMTSV
ncbi:hypothetical protein EYC84_008354 [Monilinia fructicola]|uniref:Uncharacterized protein n=1 Tax=Monilinia fructicola TaxID=38448 RepID=A0A5M9JE98_MONFR|nr:hypothetical protein EYC84_008354 [Monilinia fructicola]